MDRATLTIRQAAARLGMTPQGVRKAVRERRLAGTARLLPSGRREYAVPEEAIEAYLAGRRSDFSSEIDTLSMQLELAERAVIEKVIEIVTLRARIDRLEGDLRRTTDALLRQFDVIRALTVEHEAPSGGAGGTG